MTADVLIFGPAAQAAHADRVAVRLPAAATARDVLAALADQHPRLRFALPAARLAVNHRFAQEAAPVRPGDELALIALVGGG